MAAVFDVDPEPLYAIIRDSEADEFVRAKMLQTIAMVTRRGELPRDVTISFLRDCFARLEPREDCYVWSGWVDAVVWLGLSELKPLVQQAFQRGSIDPTWLTFEDFEEDLQYSVDYPEDDPLNADGDLTLFGETVAEMSGWDAFQPKPPRHEASHLKISGAFGTPHRDPLRNVGRNDPCPCGSGKKFKKCCLNAASEPPAEGAPPWESAAPSGRNR